MLTNSFDKKIKFSLPNFLKFAFLNEFFILLQESRKDVFNDNFEITAVEGCFPYSIWSLEKDKKYANKLEIENIINCYSTHNIGINYVFDNDCLSKDDLSDNFSNIILKCAHKNGNGVLVKSKILYDYIKKNYPLYNLIKIVSPEDFNKKNIAISDKYNNQFDSSDIKHKESTYITLNPLCDSKCKKYDEHRILFGKQQTNYSDVSNSYLCPLKKDTNFYDLTGNTNFVSFGRMTEYINDGFENFRISYPSYAKSIDIQYSIFDAIESYIYYLIKPEKQKEIRDEALICVEGFRNGKI